MAACSGMSLHALPANVVMVDAVRTTQAWCPLVSVKGILKYRPGSGTCPTLCLMHDRSPAMST